MLETVAEMFMVNIFLLESVKSLKTSHLSDVCFLTNAL